MSFRLIRFLITLIILSLECRQAEGNHLKEQIPFSINNKSLLVDSWSGKNYSYTIVGLPHDNKILAFLQEKSSNNATLLWNQTLNTTFEGEIDNKEQIASLKIR
jgi:hypothetical protein